MQSVSERGEDTLENVQFSTRAKQFIRYNGHYI